MDRFLNILRDVAKSSAESISKVIFFMLLH